MGDFNLTKIDWSGYFTTLNHTTADSKLLLFSQKCSFRQSVLEATHDNNYTDLVFISYDNYVADVKTDLPFYTSDHASINFDIIFDACDVQSHEDLSVNHVTTSDRLDFDKIDYAGFAVELIITIWPLIFSVNDNIEYAWERFSSYILHLILKFTPKKSKINYKLNLKNSEHFPRELLSLINRKKAVWSMCKKYRRNIDKITFQTLARQGRMRIDAYR